MLAVCAVEQVPIAAAAALHDTLAREYILALKSGQSPALPEQLGTWTKLCHQLQEYAGDPRFEQVLSALIKTGKYAGLEQPLAPPPAAPSSSIPIVEIKEETCPPLPADLLFPAGFSERAWRIGARYEQYSREVSPEGHAEFHESCFVGMLSTVAARRVRIPFSRRDYTPLMIVLAARPSLYKKTSTATVARDILDAAGLGWMFGSGKLTPQKLVYDMAGSLSKDYADLDAERQARIRQRLAFSGQRGLIVGEFGKMVKSIMNPSGSMADFQSLLLEMDDCRDMYDNSTISRGDEIIEKPYLALLGCMTPANLRESGKRGAEFWSDGFWSRFAFVCPPADTYLDHPYGLGDVLLPWEVVEAMRSWHQRLGVPQTHIVPVYDEHDKCTGRYDVARDPLPERVCTFGEGVYGAWVRYRSALKAMIASMHIEDVDSSYDRLPVKAMRVAALLASLENDNRIELWHWAKAQEIAERWRRSLHELYAQVNAPSGYSMALELEDKIISVMQRLTERGEKEITSSYLQGSYLKSFAREEIEEKMRALVRTGSLMMSRTKTNSTMKYSLAG